MNAQVWFWVVVRNESRRAVREDNYQGFGCDSRFMLNKVFGALAANLGSGLDRRRCVKHDSLFFARLLREQHSHCCVSGGKFHVWIILRRWFGVVLQGSEAASALLDVGKMVAVEYEGETRLFHYRLILRTASTAGMLNTTAKMCDSPNALFWILTLDVDVYPELLRVPPTGITWLNGTNLSRRR